MLLALSREKIVRSFLSLSLFCILRVENDRFGRIRQLL